MAPTQVAATRMLRVMMAAALLLPISLFVYASWIAHGNIHQAVDERLERSLEVLHEQTLNIFQSAAFAISVTEQLTEGMSKSDIVSNEKSLHEKLRKLDGASEIVKSLWIYDEDGQALVSDVKYPLTAAENYADRDYFYVQKKKNAGTYVGEVFTPRLRLGGPVIGVSRRLHPETGVFNGVIEASIDPERFKSFFSRLSTGTDSYFALVREDGSFLARYPAEKRPPGAKSPLTDAVRAKAESGFFTAVSASDGIERRLGFRKIAGYPVYVLAGRTTSSIFHEWVTTMAVHLIFGIPATALLFGITGLTLQRTRRLQVEAKRRELAEEALRQSQKMEAIGQLTGGVAHDFNNLLTIIIGNLDLAQKAAKNNAEGALVRIETFLKNAMQGARRAASLTQHLLAFSRRQPLEPRPVRADKLVQGMSDLLRQSLGEMYEVEIVGAGGLWQIECDPVQLESAILNLALNARDAMPSGGKLTIETSNAFLDDDYARRHSEVHAGQYVQIAISDTGEGMDSETIAKAFEPFFTTKPAGQGTGLGLSQVYGYAKQSGGHVKIYSEAGEGTTVKIYFPRLFTETDALPKPPRSTGGAGEGETILVVEDDEDVRAYVASILRDANYNVFHAADASSAEMIVTREDGKIDLILTDVVLPGKNGRQFTDEVRSRYPEIKVLFMTGYSRNAIVHQGRLDPGVALIQKPIMQSNLVEKIREILKEAIPPEAGLAATS